MSSTIYLVQGKAALLQNYQGLAERDDVDVLLLSYDQQIPGAFYLPDSTWAEGRNHLLEKALECGRDYRYFIFLDDDVRFQQGGFEEFERLLARYHPAVAVPVFAHKTQSTVIGLGWSAAQQAANALEAQLCRRADAQFLALHRDVVKDRLAVPLRTECDALSWWYTSSTQQLILLNIYPRHFLQFNRIVIDNDHHGEYPLNDFKQVQRQWLSAQFRKGWRDPRPFADSLLRGKTVVRLIKTRGLGAVLNATYEFLSTLIGTLTYSQKRHYRVPEDQVRRLLASDSDLLKQYENGKR